MSKYLSLAAGVAAAAFLCAGCYDYPKPPTATLTHSARKMPLKRCSRI